MTSMTNAWTLAFVALSVFTAGVMRGFSGFGAALFAVPALSMVFPPASVAPVVMGLQVLSGLQTMRGDLPHILWRCAIPLALASVATAMIGAHLLVSTDPTAVRLAMGVIVLATVALLMSGWRFARVPGLVPTALVGACSGLLNGFAAMGGPPLVAYFLGGPFEALAVRATMTMIFTAQSAMSLASIAFMGDLSWHTLLYVAITYPAQAAGIVLGQRLFRKVGGAYYRRVCIIALGVLAVLLIARSAWTLLD